ncbi:MAG: aminotransferase, partial [Halanaerobiales bacterium]
MRRLEELTRNEFDQLKKTIDEKYEGYKKEKLSLDMSRGKPCAEQLDLARGFFDNTGSLISRDGIDCRNYGQLTGLPEVKELFASLLEVEAEEVIIGENSSLAMIYDTFA